MILLGINVKKFFLISNCALSTKKEGEPVAKDFMTDEQVEMEIARLNASEEVQLARKETSIKLRRRKYMYQLRYMEKRGEQLKKQGITLENMESVLFGEEECEI